ncbi:MAG TPA: hypothetical protein VH879_02825 [Gemmatimonadales bacterium]|jgi:predicted protein tyrosine phosphatase
MNQRQPILFICTHNQSRSYTAEYLFRESTEYEARSAGTDPDARIPVSVDLIAWAARIFVMEALHLSFLRERFAEHLGGKELVCLEIPDVYMPLEPELMILLEDKLAPYLASERDRET